jgi:uncharacterized protein
VKPQPLTDAEFERLSRVLGRFDTKHPMNLEELDGFFAALICGPEVVRPSEYLPVIWGDNIILDDSFGKQPVLQDFLSLIVRHWNVIANTLYSGDVFLPLLLEDDDGATHGNDWATGFRCGMEFHKERWAALLADDGHGGLLVPIFALAHEHDPDPEMRPYKEALSGEEREKFDRRCCCGSDGDSPLLQIAAIAKRSPLIAPRHSAETCQRLGATIRVHVDQEINVSSAVDERRFIEQPYAAPRSVCGRTADTQYFGGRRGLRKCRHLRHSPSRIWWGEAAKDQFAASPLWTSRRSRGQSGGWGARATYLVAQCVKRAAHSSKEWRQA